MAAVISMHKKFFVHIFVFASIAFLTNFLWESLHAIFLYEGLNILGIERYVQLMLNVSLKDMAWLLATFFGLAVYYRDLGWFLRLSHGKIQAALLVPLVIALLIEMQGVFVFQKWIYSPLMPTLFGIGVSPLLQLPCTFVFALLLIRRIGTQKDERSV